MFEHFHRNLLLTFFLFEVGETRSLRTAAAQRLPVSASDDMIQWSTGVVIIGKGNPSTLPTTNSTWTTLRLNRGLGGDEMITNCLNYGTV